MTREQAASDIKEKLVELDRDQLVAFFAAMEDGGREDLLEDACELINDIFGPHNQIEDVEEVHTDIAGIIENIKSDDEGEGPEEGDED